MEKKLRCAYPFADGHLNALATALRSRFARIGFMQQANAPKRYALWRRAGLRAPETIITGTLG